MHLTMRIPTFIAGHIASYLVVIYRGSIGVYRKEGAKPLATEKPKRLAGFLKKAEDLRLGWAELEGGDEVIYMYDKGDGNFGYAINLDSPQCSEWGYAPL